MCDHSFVQDYTTHVVLLCGNICRLGIPLLFPHCLTLRVCMAHASQLSDLFTNEWNRRFFFLAEVVLSPAPCFIGAGWVSFSAQCISERRWVSGMRHWIWLHGAGWGTYGKHAIGDREAFSHAPWYKRKYTFQSHWYIPGPSQVGLYRASIMHPCLRSASRWDSSVHSWFTPWSSYVLANYRALMAGAPFYGVLLPYRFSTHTLNIFNSVYSIIKLTGLGSLSALLYGHALTTAISWIRNKHTHWESQ